MQPACREKDGREIGKRLRILDEIANRLRELARSQELRCFRIGESVEESERRRAAACRPLSLKTQRKTGSQSYITILARVVTVGS